MAGCLTQRRRAAEVVKVRLGEVCEIARIESLREESVWLLNLDMVEQRTGRVIQKLFVSQADLGQSVVAFDDRCVLYSKLRPNKVVLPDSYGYASSELVPLLPDETICQQEDLAAFLRSDGFVRYATTKAFGAKMPRLGSKDLISAAIPLPPLAEQKQIAAKLDRICEIVSKREEQLKKLDQLVKSRFVEMFGECEDLVSLDQVGQIFTGSTPPMKIQLPLPPIGEQRKFAAFVAEVDKSKFAVRKSLESYQKLYRQQLQEAFG